jgi:excisionase family DNA binding protein
VPRTSKSPDSESSNKPASVIVITPKFLWIPDAAAYQGSTTFFVEELLRSGELPYRQVGKHRVIAVRDLDQWAQRQPIKRGKAPGPPFQKKGEL